LLIGLGLGPGDPELLTLRGVRLLREADQVFVPGTIAARLVEQYCSPTILEFPMTDQEHLVRSALERSADQIAPIAQSGLAVFGMLGDPSFYSTFSRLSEVIGSRYPDIACVPEPGVSAITAFASVARLSLRGEVLVSDGQTGPQHRILLKVRNPREAAERLKQEGFSRFTLVERMYMEGMQIHGADDLPERCDYMSILYAGK
jgi:precorrin-2/cobalt-factor-2 C20-methyltransferase